MLWLIAGILVIWALLTLWVEAQGPARMDESNVAVAQDLAEKFGQEMALTLRAQQDK